MSCATKEEIWDRLKRETAEQHIALEQKLDLLRPDFALGDYVRLLTRFYGFYEPWESCVFTLLRGHAAELSAGRQKVSLLREDLKFLGADPETAPLARTLPPLHCYSEAVGSLYVVEGSTLGGQLLARHFTQHLNLSGLGLSFFRCYGSETGAMWKNFWKAMQKEPYEGDVVVRSAAATFNAMKDWLTAGDKE